MSFRFRSAPRSRSRGARFSVALLAGPVLASLAIARQVAAQPLYGNRESFWQGQVGMRSTFVTDPGFDPFASDNVLTSFSLGVSRTVFDYEAFSLAPGFFWEYGARSAMARDQPTSLSTHRLALALEGRYHFAPWVYGLVRLTPSAIQQSAQLSDQLAIAPFVANAWTFGLDASAGAAFLLGPHSDASASPVRWWLAAEGGYGYASSATLQMHPDLASDDPRRTGDLDLGRLALGGGFFRIYGSVTF
ncbi:MAG TPA: hypothetical protein VK550_10085 [Polyangiaceae bacterium]|nr:hypothetical protein [Polyangiaceae bacterium]